MARNSKRNAFTIVELVIVIAVIAILSTVLITTFTGVIESANVSADKQLLSTLNTQLSMHIGKGNDIDTVDDLKTALNTQDINYWEKLDPKSAQYGYHYWYNSEKQEIVLATYDEIAKEAQKKVAHVALARFLGAVSYAPKARTIDNGFETASPRTVLENFYFLDQKGKNANEIADFYAEIEAMGAEDYYSGAISNLKGISGKNASLANAIYGVMKATAIVTNNGVFVTSDATEINHVFVPENSKNVADYYLGQTFKNDSKEDNSVDVSKLTIDIKSTITLPDNVKVTEGAMQKFVGKGEGGVTLPVDINLVVKDDKGNVITDAETLKGELKEIFSADSVTATVTINGNQVVTVSGSKIEGDIKVDGLTCKNPVTSFNAGVSGNQVNNYIALDKIANGISLKLIADTFVGTEGATTPLYENVTWVADNGVTVDAFGNVTFPEGFSASTVTFTGTATGGIATKTVTVNVVTFDTVTVEFNGVDVVLNNKNEITPDKDLFVGVAENTANFGFTTGKLAYVYSGKAFTLEQLRTMGVEPTVTITTEGAYFSKDSTIYDADFLFKKDKIGELGGGFAMQNVTVNVNVTKDTTYSGTVAIKVKDNTNSPYVDATPSYKKSINYIYKVGNKNVLAVSELFERNEKITVAGDLSDHMIYVYNKAAVEGYFYDEITKYSLSTKTINFGDTNYYKVGETYYLVLGTGETDENGKPLVSEDETVSAVLKVTVVDGYNVTTEDEFTNVDPTVTDKDGKYTYPIKANAADTVADSTKNIVLHNPLKFEGYTSRVRIMSGATLYGNYFTIEVPDFYDPDKDTTNGLSFLQMSNSTLNQTIIDGPVYHSASLAVTNIDLSDIMEGLQTNAYGFFAYGIMCDGATVINDSYISGFNSPVRITGTFEAVNTTFDGGAWSNIFVNNATKVTLTNCTTIQQAGGYKCTEFTTTDKVADTILGMGIYVHGKTQSGALTIDLNNTKQYNWVNENYKGKHGFYMDMAIERAFDSKNNAALKTYLHNDGYINAAVISLGIEAKFLWQELANFPVYTGAVVDDTDNVEKYTTGNPSISEFGSIKYGNGYRVSVKVYSNGCTGDNCTCTSTINYKCSAADFANTKIN